jgi:hypothetical protein
MHKLLLMSVLLATAFIPLFAARESTPERGLYRTVIGVCTFNFVYLLAVTIIYPRICW